MAIQTELELLSSRVISVLLKSFQQGTPDQKSLVSQVLVSFIGVTYLEGDADQAERYRIEIRLTNIGSPTTVGYLMHEAASNWESSGRDMLLTTGATEHLWMIFHSPPRLAKFELLRTWQPQSGPIEKARFRFTVRNWVNPVSKRRKIIVEYFGNR